MQVDGWFSTILLGVVTIAISTIGPGILFWQVRLLHLGWSSRRWPTVLGAIVSSEIAIRHRSSGRGTYKGVSVAYEYIVNGITYTGTRISFPNIDSGLGYNPHQVISRYPQGKNVTVHYHPSKPQIAVLETGINTELASLLGITVTLGVGSAFSIGALGMVAVALTR